MPRRIPFSRRLLVLAAKVPAPGRVKTRLTQTGVSEANAVRLAEAFLRDSLQKIADCPVPAERWLALDGMEESPDLPEFLRPPGVSIMPQNGNDLGEKMGDLFKRGFAAGFAQIIIIGSDTPHLPPAFLVDAWGRLEAGADLVLGPADDGGYYLIGLRSAQAIDAGVLDNIAWSTDAVLGQTREKAIQANLSAAQTPPWYDIDTSADLRRLQTDLIRGSVSAPHTRDALALLPAKNE